MTQTTKRHQPMTQTTIGLAGKTLIRVYKQGIVPIRKLANPKHFVHHVFQQDGTAGITWFEKGAEKAELWNVKLSNGGSVEATEYLNFILVDGTLCQLKDLAVGAQLLTTAAILNEAPVVAIAVKSVRNTQRIESVYSIDSTFDSFTLEHVVVHK